MKLYFIWKIIANPSLLKLETKAKVLASWQLFFSY
jgi:hypothetical protein